MVRSILRHLKNRSIRIGAALAGAVVILSTYQNCAPVGDALGVGTNSSLQGAPGGNGGPVPPICIGKGPPIITSGPANQTATSGLAGNFSGSDFPQNLVIGVGLNYPSQSPDVDCESSIEGLNVNCNNPGNVDINGTIECLSGVATVTATVSDNLCNRDGNSITFQVAIENKCPFELPLKEEALGSSVHVGSSQDQFGSRVAMSGNWAVVVANGDDERGTNAGAAFIYNFNGSAWNFVQKLIPATVGDNSEIITAAISGNTLILGAPSHGNYGAAFLFRFNGSIWVEGPTLAPSVVNASVRTMRFGYDVGISGGNIIVGAPGYSWADPTNFASAGAAFVYSDNGSAVTQTMILDARSLGLVAQDFFGAAVAISGNNMVVGAPLSPSADRAGLPGKAFSFINGSAARLNPGVTEMNGHLFGYSVDIDGNRVVVGAKLGSGMDGGARGGAAYFFNGTTSNPQRIIGPDTAAGDEFGTSVAILGNNLVVGAPKHAVGQVQQAGTAHYFKLNGATFLPAFNLMPRMAGRRTANVFGASVDLNGTYAIGGSPADDLGATVNSGSSYIIQLP